MERKALFFLDECRTVISTSIKKVLAKVGSKPVMRVNIGFSSIYVILAINAWTGEVVVSLAKRPNSESVKYFLRYFKRRVGSGRVYMVMDNYSPHKTKGTLEVCRRKGIHPVFTPPYSPELNMAEAVFKSLKNYMSNKIFYTIEDVKNCIKQFFKENKYRFNLNAITYLGLDKIEV
ncbi:Second ORF in transposon ISC1048 [Saccharolobus solfataricus P2]|uniref:Second ORF in transposon ISC1048 n=2 Tax=Saccharolobus solfataricus TaxID=2287 RepID=Q97XL1_SACS2|nr:Second ORF in transposon ISC1048 [Saccharolobus solfataricus P2]SAI85033.1 ORF2 in transposon ISC1048 [Saccharolobus solfataricus]